MRSKRIHWREQDAEEVSWSSSASCWSPAASLTSRPGSEQFYGEHRGRFYFPRLASSPLSRLFLPSALTSPFLQVQHATSGPFVALALCAPDAIQRWRGLIGPTHVYKGQWEKPETLRARYGLSDTRNGFHGEAIPLPSLQLALTLDRTSQAPTRPNPP